MTNRIGLLLSVRICIFLSYSVGRELFSDIGETSFFNYLNLRTP